MMVKVAAYRLKYIHLQIYNCLLEEAIILSKSRGLPITINKDSIILQIRKCIKFPVPMIHELPKRIQRFVMIIGDLMITSAKPIGITGTESP